MGSTYHLYSTPRSHATAAPSDGLHKANDMYVEAVFTRQLYGTVNTSTNFMYRLNRADKPTEN